MTSTLLDLTMPGQLMTAIGPDLVLVVGTLLLVLWSAWRPDSDRHQRSVGFGGIAVCVAAFATVIWYIDRYESAATGPVGLDTLRWYMDLVILLGAGLCIGLSIEDNRKERIRNPDGHVLVLLAASGMMLLAAARDLMIVFLGVELMSISVYALAAINRRSARGAEGALKYFLLGAFSTAFFLYGIALIYGATGSTNLTRIAFAISRYELGHTPLVLVGMAMLLIGFGFKVASVPFHMWAPDVYDGAPSPITAYMAATVKAAAFAAFARVWIESFGGAFLSWYPALHGLAVATMITGNAIGLAQRNMKRLLAYSSIGHAGYLLVAVASGNRFGAMAMVFYLFVYTLATFGAFAILSTLTQPGKGTVMLDELAGLWKTRPWLAMAMAVIMFSLLGFPFVGGAGFLAKWYVLRAAMLAPVPLVVLSVVLVLTTVVSAGYYLHVVMVMFMRPRPDDAVETAPSTVLTRSIMFAAVVLILLLGVAPEPIVRWTMRTRPELGLINARSTPSQPPGPRTGGIPR